MKLLALLGCLLLASCDTTQPPAQIAQTTNSLPPVPPLPSPLLVRSSVTKAAAVSPSNATVQLGWVYTNWARLDHFDVMASSNLSVWSLLMVAQTNSCSVSMSGQSVQFFKVEDYGTQSSASFGWDSEADAAGYHFYQGASDGNYTNVIDCGGTPSITVPFPVGASYFAVSAYDFSGTESPLSPSLCVTNAPVALGTVIPLNIKVSP